MIALERYRQHRDALSQVLDPRTHTIEWLDDEVVSGRALVWTTDTAIILAEIKIYPTGAMELHGLIAHGDVEAIVNGLIPTAEQWARDNGFLFTSIASRAGWSKLLEKDGYAVHQVYIRKELV